MKRTSFVIIMVVTFLMVIFLHAHATRTGEPIQLGEITSFSGEVLIKTKGTWSKLEKTPCIIFSTDKIVTRRGRAEVRLVDGGIIRIDLDSNLSIAEKEDAEGFMVRKKVTARQVNLLVGGIWFDIKVKKKERVKFRTPTMTAGIRGTSGEFRVGIKGDTQYGLATGKADTIGNYNAISHPTPISHSDIIEKSLPKSNPFVDKSPIQQSAIKAFENQFKAALAAQKAADLSRMARTASERAGKEKTEAARLHAQEAQKVADLAQREATLAKNKALLAIEQEVLFEAELFQDTNDVVFLKDSVEKRSKALENIKMLDSQPTRPLKEGSTRKKDKNISTTKEVKAPSNKKVSHDRTPSQTSVDTGTPSVKENPTDSPQRIAHLGEGWIEDDPLAIETKTVKEKKEEVSHEKISWWEKFKNNIADLWRSLFD
ncbi:MAG: FecR domain-containing protein [bacterium]